MCEEVPGDCASPRKQEHVRLNSKMPAAAALSGNLKSRVDRDKLRLRNFRVNAMLDCNVQIDLLSYDAEVSLELRVGRSPS